MDKVSKACFVVSLIFLAVSVLCFSYGMYKWQDTKYYRANNVQYVVAQNTVEPATVTDESVTDTVTDSGESKTVDTHITAEEVQKLVESSEQWQDMLDSISNVMYTEPILDSVVPNDNNVVLKYTFEASQGAVKCVYNKATGKIKVGKPYNRAGKKYPVLFWECGYIPDINKYALDAMASQGYKGVYTCEGGDGSTGFGFMDNDYNTYSIEL